MTGSRSDRADPMSGSRSRSRSRSPATRPHRRSRSPRSKPHSHRTHHHGRHHHKSRKEKGERDADKPSVAAAKPLPYDARHIVIRDYAAFRPMFALYLDIQKGLEIEDLESSEVKGRWKSFIGKWNRGELAEGWYDPATLQKAIESASTTAPVKAPPPRRSSPIYEAPERSPASEPLSDDDEPGPSLPDQYLTRKATASRPGPAIPSMQDLELKKEMEAESSLEVREALRLERRANRKLETERLNELVPRAEAGSRERQLEKKRELATANRAFATAKEGGDVADVPEADLMGDDGDGLGSFKRQRKEAERKKNEREIRREEIMRARKEEREVRAREFKEREDRTMKGLVELARKRFG